MLLLTFVYVFRATFLQHETNRVEKLNLESLAHPGVMRPYDGKSLGFYLIYT